MNKKLILGIGFQLMQLVALLVWGLSWSFQYLPTLTLGLSNMSQQTYQLIFGGITLLGLNILSLFLIINGINNDNSTKYNNNNNATNFY